MGAALLQAPDLVAQNITPPPAPGSSAASAPAPVGPNTGAFGFPQSSAIVLCNTSDLRVSAWSNDQYLAVQAVLWKDGSTTLGKMPDGRATGDTSSLMLDFGAKGKIKPRVDRVYTLDPWPDQPGLSYQITLSDHSWTPLMSDSKGRGAIRYEKTANGKVVRVDTYLIPLQEIARRVGETIQVCYYASSPAPKFAVDSVGYLGAGKPYYSYSIPHARYDSFILKKGSPVDLSAIPDGRQTLPPPK